MTDFEVPVILSVRGIFAGKAGARLRRDFDEKSIPVSSRESSPCVSSVQAPSGFVILGTEAMEFRLNRSVAMTGAKPTLVTCSLCV